MYEKKYKAFQYSCIHCKIDTGQFSRISANLVLAVDGLALSQWSRERWTTCRKMRTEGLLMQGDSMTHPSSTIGGFKWQVPTHAGPCALAEEREFW